MSDLSPTVPQPVAGPLSASGLSLGPLLARWPALLAAGVVAGAAGFGIASLVPPTFTAHTTLLPPQQQQSAAAAAISSLGNLASLAGGAVGLKTPADQYVALLQSTTVADRLIDQFKLMDVYEEKFRQDARKELANNSRIAVGKKDGLITIDVDDHDPKRAADMANAYVDQLRQLTNTLAVSEAQQRRMFFEQQLKHTRDNLVKAQLALGAAGINQGDLKAEPKAVAERYVKLRAEVTAAEARLQALSQMLTPNAPEIAQQRATIGALRGELARAEQGNTPGGRGADSEYVTNLREFKYQETLFELFARQYELARVDESREGAIIQVVDKALPPERKSKPRRAVIALASAALGVLLCAVFIALRTDGRPRVRPSAP